MCQQLPKREYFSYSVLLKRSLLLFSLFVSARGPDGLAGWAGELLGLGPTKELPSLGYEDRAQNASTSTGVEETLMMDGAGFLCLPDSGI